MSKTSDIWAIVPVKGTGEPKRRLAKTLDLQHRVRLQLIMAEHVLSELSSSEKIDSIMVVSENFEYKTRLCKRSEIFYHYGDKTSVDFNRVLTKAAQYAQKRGATTIVIIQADLPLLRVSDIDHFIDSHITKTDRPVVTLVSNRDATGTNCLACTPIFKLPYVFGHNSFNHYKNLAQNGGIDFCNLDLPSLQFDIDEPDDLMNYLKNKGQHLIKEFFDDDMEISQLLTAKKSELM